jgi:2-polyprenyl-3-methyl-5-hydroxy-6-metoxy-1,4-benzoquinol methylase
VISQTTPATSARESNLPSRSEETIEAIRAYWNEHIHDLQIARHPVGRKEFFDEIEAYRFDKLEYLPRVVGYSSCAGKRLLEVGCGIGIDLVRFAKHGAIVTGIDLAETAIGLAKKNMELHGVVGDLQLMNGENLQFGAESFDVVFAHGVLQYTPDPKGMSREIHRVLKPGGLAILMVYNRYSWLNLLALLFGVKLEYADAPAFKKYSISEFKQLLTPFSRVELIPERFPVRSRLHKGLKAEMYNRFFVDAFNLIPRAMVRPFGWHLMAKAIK